MATGTAKVNISTGLAGANATQTTSVTIAPIAPALFVFNNEGLAASYAVQVSATGAQTVEMTYAMNSGGALVAAPVNVSAGPTYLILYGSGIQAAGTAGITITIGGVPATATYAGPSPYAGVDQVNVLIPASLAGSGNVNIQLGTLDAVSGFASAVANAVQITIQ